MYVIGSLYDEAPGRVFFLFLDTYDTGQVSLRHDMFPSQFTRGTLCMFIEGIDHQSLMCMLEGLGMMRPPVGSFFMTKYIVSPYDKVLII